MAIPRALTPAGVVLVDKEAGPSSFAVVHRLRNRTGARAGHAGTLDPFASGLLLVFLGAATKIVQRFVGLDKRYLTDVDLTAVSTTGDPEGVLDPREPPEAADLERMLDGLRGEIELPVPAYSAVKIDGRRAYALARSGTGGRDAGAALDGSIVESRLVRRADGAARHARQLGHVRASRRGRAGRALRDAAPHRGRPVRRGRGRRGHDRAGRPGAGPAVTVARSPGELERRPRAVAIGTFDGVHRGHQRVIRAALDAGLVPTVVTFHPHPREVLGNRVEALATLERRLELIAALGVEDVLVVEFTPEVAEWPAEEFAERVLGAIGAEVVVAGAGFRFGHRRGGDLDQLRRLGFDAREVPLVEGVSSSHVRRLVAAGEMAGAAAMLGRPPEVDGTVVSGDARGGTLGFPTANLAVDPRLLVPAFGIYAGAAGDIRAAVSIGLNPHYGGGERRIEAFLLDFEGDLYGKRLVVELWRRLRDERAFASEADLVAQIARDVEQTRAAERP